MSGIEIGMLVFVILAVLATVGLIVLFAIRFGKYGYVGNVYLYIVSAYLLCFAFSLFVNFNKIPINEAGEPLKYNVNFANPFIAIATSAFDALKMMAVAADQTVMGAYFTQSTMYYVFGVTYYAVCVFSLIATSITVILFFAKSFKAKLLNLLRSIFYNRANVYYIFSEAKVANAARKLAMVLRDEKDENGKKKHNIVIMYVSKASLKTQEGTEYRDALINVGLDVKNEAFSGKLCYYLFKKFFNRNFRHFLFLKKWPYHHRRITVYGLFDDDDSAVELANNFRKGIARNEFFYEYYSDPKLFLKVGSNVNLCPKNAEKIKARKAKRDEKENKKYEAKLNQAIKKINDNKSLSDEEKEEAINNVKNELHQEKVARTNELIDYVKRYRVFVTFQDSDIDLSHNFSGQTLHIVNTLSQYDMVSAEFLLNNQIVDFLRRPDSDEIILDKNNKDSFHVSFFGFGSINRPIFEKMTYAYQLWEDHTHKVHYHIYDYRADEIVEQIQNEFTNDVIQGEKAKFFEKPQLFTVDKGISGKNLTSYEVLINHFRKLKDENTNGTRFNENGFEIFVVSAKSTSADIQIATSLRKVLVKLFDKEKLKKTYIFVRIGNISIANNLLNQGKVEDRYIFDQDYLAKGQNNIKPVPIIIFGQHTNMADFISKDYDILVKLGSAAYASYCGYKDEDAEREWLKIAKQDVMENTATVYSLKTKLAILGYRLENWVVYDKNNKVVTLEEFNKVMEEEKRKALYIQKPDFSSPMMHLAGLEHNRWMATAYVINKYSQLEKDTFTSVFETKAKEKTLNVCMTTNDGIHKLYEYGISKGWDRAKALDVCFNYDVNAMNKMFNVLLPEEVNEDKKDEQQQEGNA